MRRAYDAGHREQDYPIGACYVIDYMRASALNGSLIAVRRLGEARIPVIYDIQ